MVVAVVVTYEPDLAALYALLHSLRSQVSNVIVVDNGSSLDICKGIDTAFFVDSWCELVRLPTNLGIAAALNVGIDWARRRGAGYVVLFDQDSLPAPDMVQRLTEVIQAKQAAGCKVAAVGPRYMDERQDNPPPFIRIRGFKLVRQACNKSSSIVDVDYLISSGCLIPMSTLDVVNLMQEELFIDYVDIEWGLRAKRKGFRSYGVCSAKMKHDLGETPLSFLGKKIPLHSPLRHYYHFRNAIWLYRQQWVPVNWKFVDGWKLLLKYVFYALFAKPRWSHFRMMTLGVWHGLRGRMGELNASR